MAARTYRRIYLRYEKLEEFKAGMWKIVRGVQRERNVFQAAALMRDIPAFSQAMLQAVHEWQQSCAHNLTSENSNRLAWLGHAGCCIAVMSPEENTRAAWHTLNKVEQDLANEAAQQVLEYWEKEAGDLHALQMRFPWDMPEELADTQC